MRGCLGDLLVVRKIAVRMSGESARQPRLFDRDVYNDWIQNSQKSHITKMKNLAFHSILRLTDDYNYQFSLGE